MNKKLSFLLALMLALTALCGLSLAQDADQKDIVSADLTGSFEEGGYVVRIPLTGDSGTWKAEAPEAGAVRLTEEKEENGVLTVRFDAEADGTSTVSLMHFAGIACDRIHTMDLLVKDGKIAEVTGGSFTASPSDEELEPALSGNWAEQETQFTELTLTRNEQGGFDAEVAAPLTHGAYILKATAYYDCRTDSLIYENGCLYTVPITAEANPDLGEPVSNSLSGSFTLIPQNETGFALQWATPEEPSRVILFEKGE